MITATKSFHFAAAHRLLDHEGLCKFLHGHNYRIEITAVREGGLDELGRVIDFSELKESVGRWIDRNWDHATILQKEDPLVEWLLRHDPTLTSRNGDIRVPRVFLLHGAPTAENMARYLLEIIQLGNIAVLGVKIANIRVYETETCWADASAHV